MEEETMIIVPYIHYKAPPRCIDTKSMLQYVHEELDQWTKTLNSKLSIYDGIHMKNLKKKVMVYISYIKSSVTELNPKKRKENKNESRTNCLHI